MKTKANPFLRPAYLTAAVLALGSAAAQATTFTWDGSSNNNWNTNRWPTIAWVNGANDAVVNSGDVFSTIGISATSLTIGDGIGAAGSASARNALNNAFAGIGTIIINSDGVLGSGGNTTTHLGAITLNGGTIGGSDNGGNAALFGMYNFDNTVTVNGGANTSTISTTGGGIALTQSGGTIFNVADGAAAVDLLVTGTFLHKPPHITSTGLVKTGAGTMNLTNINTYLGGTTVNAGTLGLGASGGATGTIRGTLNINNSGTMVKLNASDTLGFGGAAQSVNQVNVTGGTIDNAVAGNNAYETNFTLTGGTISSTGGGTFHFNNGFAISSLASADTSTVSAGITLRNNNVMTISVANGAAATDLLISGAIGGQNGAEGITKTGAGTLVLSTASNSYTGATTVSAGTLLVNGSLGNTAVAVNSTSTVGGSGSIGGSLSLNGSSTFHVVDFLDALTVAGTVTIYNGFGVDDLTGFTWGSVADGTYTLINGTLGAGVFAGLANNSLGTAFDIDGMLGSRVAYFQEGSLQLVVIPEPGAALLGGLGMLALLRRRRA